ncbi:MAG TPA: hypothetical protein DD473_18695 [Planctomycetaceae bacterium]|nr:hypothetical protein [Planctomycetaceae bacterium]
MLNAIVNSDLSLVFADFGKAVVYRVVESSVDAASLVVEEELTDVELLAMPGHVDEQRLDVADGQSRAGLMELVIRVSELPEDCPSLTDRVVMEGEEYAIVDFRFEQVLGVVQLTVRRR